MTTDKQIAANRRDSLKSTGPRTPEGKARVRRNALKHGILATTLLATDQDAASFQSLLDDLLAAFDPRDALEEHLIETVAVAYWRQHRVLRTETLTVRADVDTIESRRDAEWQRRLSDIAYELDPAHVPESLLGWHDDARDVYPDLLTFSRGVAWLLSQLEDLRRLLTDRPEDAPALGRSLAVIFCVDDSELGKLAAAIPLALYRGSFPSPLPAEYAARLLSAIDRRREGLEELFHTLEDQERAALTLRKASTTLPDSAELNKLIRYEKAATTQLYRALDQLERHRRVCSAVPTPASMPST
jgi:hypothetical protein